MVHVFNRLLAEGEVGKYLIVFILDVEANDDNLGLIVGVSVGSVVLIPTITAVIVILKR